MRFSISTLVYRSFACQICFQLLSSSFGQIVHSNWQALLSLTLLPLLPHPAEIASVYSRDFVSVGLVYLALRFGWAPWRGLLAPGLAFCLLWLANGRPPLSPSEAALYVALALTALSLPLPPASPSGGPFQVLALGALLLLLRNALQYTALGQVADLVFLLIAAVLVSYALLLFFQHKSLLMLANQLTFHFCLLLLFSELYDDCVAFFYAASLLDWPRPAWPALLSDSVLALAALTQGDTDASDPLVSPAGLVALGMAVVLRWTAWLLHCSSARSG